MTMQDSESYRILRNKPEIRKWFYSNSVISADEQRLWFENYLHKDNEIMFSIIYRNFFAGGVESIILILFRRVQRLDVLL